MRAVARSLLALAAAAGAGCAGPRGALFTHTFQPLTTNFHATPAAGEASSGDVKEFDYYVRVLWSDNGIGKIARQNGFARVDYADLETLSVLGIWTQRWVHVYGTRAIP